MNGKPLGALRLSSIAALALATAACGGEEQSPLANGAGFSLFDTIGADEWPGGIPEGVPEFSEAEYFGDALPPLPQAVPMASAFSGDYGYAPDFYADYPVSDPIYYEPEPSDGSFAWLALAALLGGVLGDAPPDYYFDYGGVEPWAWETGDHFVRYAEPLDYGYRYYYYAPERPYPFLVRDPYYSYGYYDDQVVVIYDGDGRVLDGRRSWRQRQVARQYYARARELRKAARQGRRHGVAAPLWAERRAIIDREQGQWDRARASRAGWRDWDRRRESMTAPRWSRERIARQYAASRFDDWRDDRYRGTSPRFYREAERSPRLRRAALEQREQRERSRIAAAPRREERRGLERRDDARRSALWRAALGQGQSRQGLERLAQRDERLRDRDERVGTRRAALRSDGSARREERRTAAAFRQGQAGSEQARLERRAEARQRASGERRSGAGDDRGAAEARARREARAQQQVQANRSHRSEARIRPRLENRPQPRQEEDRMRRFQARSQEQFRAQSQQRREARVQRMQAPSRADAEARRQRDQARSHARREEARIQRRAAIQSQPRQEFGREREIQRQARQEARHSREQFRAERRQQAQVRHDRSGADIPRGGGREARIAERQQHGGNGNGRRMN